MEKHVTKGLQLARTNAPGTVPNIKHGRRLDCNSIFNYSTFYIFQTLTMPAKKVTTLSADLNEAADAITKYVSNLEKAHGINISQIEFEKTYIREGETGQTVLVSIKPNFTLTINK